ncbi:MAG TPA: SDR family NAD(P)-dependent oxidoreductase, partial [Roseiflexaceae bacterium]|nr:SDR family NAD(P)-dependent oxidoreductase [Roseiflexaceae bacterium]
QTPPYMKYYALAEMGRVDEAVAGFNGIAAELRAGGVAAHGIPADASDAASLAAAFGGVVQTYGAPEALVYNAAAVAPGEPSTLDPALVLDHLKINVVGALVSAQQVIPAMRVRGRGSILLTGGGLALHPIPQYASLALGKAAMRNLAFSLAGELAPDGIHVATVTVSGFIQPGTHFDPDDIAEEYWRLHAQPREEWQTEVVYS